MHTVIPTDVRQREEQWQTIGSGRWASTAAMAFAGVVCASAAFAQDWPSKPIRMIVPYPPAGGTDIVARVLNEKLARRARRATIIVDNKGGAAGNLGTDLAAKAPADGYTILFTLSSHTINPKLYPKLPFDVERDFAAVSLAAMIPQILVAHPSVPVNNVQELIAYAKANPGKLNFASVGIGSPGHIAGELFKLRTGVNMVHVPYKGGGPAVSDTLGGQVQLLFVSLPAAWQHVKSGKLKALGVTSDKRSIAAPDVATIVEQGVAGLCRQLVVRRVRAGEDAAGRRGETERGDGVRAADAGAQGKAAGAGRRGGVEFARGVRGAGARRTEEVGVRDPRGEDHARGMMSR